ncbi:MAG: response regulator transcription factor [bacterium]
MDKSENLTEEIISSAKKIAVVDDEPDILELVRINLKKAGYIVYCFENGNGLIKFLKNDKPDLVILDLMLPDMDGNEICKYMRKKKEFSKIPIIMLTAKTDEMDKVLGLELGADDYITKPFSLRELIARVKAAIRRSEPQSDSDIITLGDNFSMDLQKYEVLVGDEKVNLTTTEFKILQLLTSRKGWVFTREQILNHTDISNKGVLDRTVDVHIKNLRDKLGDAGIYIKNIRGIGYKVEE